MAQGACTLVRSVPVVLPAAGGRPPCLHGKAAVLGALATVATAAVIQRRRTRTSCRGFRDDGTSRANNGPAPELTPPPFKDPPPPGDLYELLKVPTGADQGTIKKAYYAMQKICHPDVAGPEGEEMCILLNDAYDVLSDDTTRTAYDEQLTRTKTGKEARVEVSEDLGPVWKWQAKQHNAKPVWRGQPRSRSRWDKVPPEDRGSKHQAQRFVYVDEWQCISCRNCCDIAPHSFCIDAEHGRARVYTQWGNSEEYLDYAVESCPVDCIYWVSREELQALEHVTAEKMEDEKGNLPCPMSIMNGMNLGRDVPDPFYMAQHFMAKQEVQQEKEKKQGTLKAAADKFQERILKAFERLSEALRSAGWGF